MADEKVIEPITLVAVERGFAMGRLVHPGEKFLFAPVDSAGKPRKLPKWAALPDDPKLTKPKPAFDGDLKPKAAQVAVRRKAGQAAGQAITD